MSPFMFLPQTVKKLKRGKCPYSPQVSLKIDKKFFAWPFLSHLSVFLGTSKIIFCRHIINILLHLILGIQWQVFQLVEFLLISKCINTRSKCFKLMKLFMQTRVQQKRSLLFLSRSLDQIKTTQVSIPVVQISSDKKLGRYPHLKPASDKSAMKNIFAIIYVDSSQPGSKLEQVHDKYRHTG